MALLTSKVQRQAVGNTNTQRHFCRSDMGDEWQSGRPLFTSTFEYSKHTKLFIMALLNHRRLLTTDNCMDLKSNNTFKCPLGLS